MAEYSYCNKEGITVNRERFDRMCVERTDLSLNDETVIKQAL